MRQLGARCWETRRKMFRWLLKDGRNPVEVFWSYMHEPKIITVTMIVNYLITFVAGVILVHRDLDFAMTLQGVILIAGGALGGFSAPAGFYKLERPATVLVSAGIVMWLIDGETLMTSLVGAMAISLYVTRFMRIRDLDVTPGEPLMSVPKLTK